MCFCLVSFCWHVILQRCCIGTTLHEASFTSILDAAAVPGNGTVPLCTLAWATWTVETSNSNVLGFTPDGQSIWAYHRGGTDPAVITFQQHDVHTGKVLVEQKVTLEISHQEILDLELVIDLLDCGKYAYLKFPLGNTQPQCKKLDLLIDLATGQVRQLPYSGTNPGVGRYAFSPRATWMSHHDGNAWVILDLQRLQPALTLKHVETAEGFIVPGRIVFSPD